jgi:predicted nucleic acid-binding protein
MAATERGERVVCDAGPLIHLDELGCAGLLDDFEEVLVPSVVWAEVCRHRPSTPRQGIRWREAAATAALPPDVQTLVHALNLHEGEREALAVALEQQVKLLLTDDTAARLAARSLGIAAHGTIGVLFRAIRVGHKSGQEIAALLRSLPSRSTLHIRRSLLEEFVQEAERVS